MAVLRGKVIIVDGAQQVLGGRHETEGTARRDGPELTRRKFRHHEQLLLALRFLRCAAVEGRKVNLEQLLVAVLLLA